MTGSNYSGIKEVEPVVSLTFLILALIGRVGNKAFGLFSSYSFTSDFAIHM